MTDTTPAKRVGYSFRVAHAKRPLITTALEQLSAVAKVEPLPLARGESPESLRRDWAGIAVLANPDDKNQVQAVGKVMENLAKKLPNSFENRGLRNVTA